METSFAMFTVQSLRIGSVEFIFLGLATSDGIAKTARMDEDL